MFWVSPHSRTKASKETDLGRTLQLVKAETGGLVQKCELLTTRLIQEKSRGLLEGFRQARVVLGQGLATLIRFKPKAPWICALGKPSGTATYTVLWSRREKQGP